MNNKDDVIKVLGVLAAAYPNFTLLPETLRIYQEALSDIDTEILEQAAKIHLVTNKYFPTIAELREQVVTILERACEVPTAAEAWQEAIEHCRRGDYEGYSHPLIEKAVRIIGIPYWQSMETTDEMATRAQFIKMYEIQLSRYREEMKFLPDTRKLIAKLTAGEKSPEKMNLFTERFLLDYQQVGEYEQNH